jgi:hypothetical protein
VVAVVAALPALALVTPPAAALPTLDAPVPLEVAGDAAVGPVGLVTKNALATGPTRTALIDLLLAEIARQGSGDVIRLTTWSFHSRSVADALVRAHRRGVSVRVVLDQGSWRTEAVRTLRSALGTSPTSRSFVVAPYEKSTHAKVATFSDGGRTVISSANVSDPRQWNHSVLLDNPDLFTQVSAWADRLAAGQGMTYTRVALPDVTLHFYPGTADPVLRAIRTAGGRAITVQMSIWKGARGDAVAAALVEAYRNGSSVVVNTGEPWSPAVQTVAAAGIDVFDTLRATDGRAKAHDKLLVVGDTVYTGSTNWGAFPRTFSEVVARIRSAELAALLREYVSRTRVQAGGASVVQPVPVPLTAAPLTGGATVTWSAIGPYSSAEVRSFVVRASVPTATGSTVLAQASVRPLRDASGRLDRYTPLTATLTPLTPGVTTRITVTPMGTSGPVGPTLSTSTVPYVGSPAVPTVTTVVPTSPTSARLAATWAPTAGSPPLAHIELAWSSDAGATWASRPLTRTWARLVDLPTGVVTRARVRAVPTVGQPSAWSPQVRVRPTARPSAPTLVAAEVPRTRTLGVTWRLPTNTGASPLLRWVVRVDVEGQRVSRTVLRSPEARGLVVTGLPRRGTAVARVAVANAEGRSPFSPAAPVQLR